MKKFLVVAAVVLAVGAFAQTRRQLDTVTSRFLQHFTPGILIVPQSLVGSDSTISANRITRSLAGSITVDFASTTIVCNDSTGLTVVGARTGDTCEVGPPASPAANSSFSCYVSATNTVIVRHCPAGTAIDPASATYNVRVFSNQ